jgi:hypothetical protein
MSEQTTPRPSHLRAQLSSTGSGISAAVAGASSELAYRRETARLEADVASALPGYVDMLDADLNAVPEDAGSRRFARLEALRKVSAILRRPGFLENAVEAAALQAEVEDRYPAFVSELDDQIAAMAAENAGTPGLEDALRYTRLEALRAAVVEIRKMGASA